MVTWWLGLVVLVVQEIFQKHRYVRRTGLALQPNFSNTLHKTNIAPLKKWWVGETRPSFWVSAYFLRRYVLVVGGVYCHQ